MSSDENENENGPPPNSVQVEDLRIERDMSIGTSMQSAQSSTTDLQNMINSMTAAITPKLSKTNETINSNSNQNNIVYYPLKEEQPSDIHSINTSSAKQRSKTSNDNTNTIPIRSSIRSSYDTHKNKNKNPLQMDLDHPHSFHVKLLDPSRSNSKKYKTPTRLRHTRKHTNESSDSTSSRMKKSTFAAYSVHDARTSYQHNLSDKFNKKRFERLNFENTINEVTHRRTWDKKDNWISKQLQARGLWKWGMCLIIGIFTGACMFMISILIEYLTDKNLSYARDGLQNHSLGVGFARFLGVNCLFALISGSMVSFIAPAAAGSGIPDVKGWLNGSLVPDLFRMKTFVVKLVGVVFSVSARFIIGKEGPMVHAGSALASGMTLGRNKTLGFDTGLGYSFRNDVDARDFVSCGAAAGVAAAFGAPIGGMLFALEEVASFWLPGLTWRAFFAAATSNLVLTLLLGCYHKECGTVSKSSLINFQNDQSSITKGQYNFVQFGFFIVMGGIGGLIGVAFNSVNVKLCLLRKKYFRKPILKLWEVMFMAIITTTLLICTPAIMGCREIPTRPKQNSIFDNMSVNNASMSVGMTHGATWHHDMGNDTSCFKDVTGKTGRYTCQKGHYNPLASLLMQSSENTIKDLFMFDSTCWDNLSLWIGGTVYFILAVMTYGLSIPSGLFIPLILIGSHFGHVFGTYWNLMFDDHFDVGTYSLIGASAVLGGSTRMTISLTAIVMEITNDIYFLMPIMMTIMISKWVGDRFNSALYDAHVALKDIPYLEPKISAFVPSYVCAEDIMRPNVVTLPSVIDLASLLDVVNNPSNHHQAFPVVDLRNKSVKWLADQGWDQTEGNLLGVILRWHIYVLLVNRCFSKDPRFQSDIPELLTREELTDRKMKNKKTIFASEFGLPESELSIRYIDFSPYMSLSPVSVHRNTPVLSLYNIYKGLGLRHLVVVGNRREIVGIITSHELCEDALEEAVERVHECFEDSLNEFEINELFEQRVEFLKGQTKTLETSGNPWLNPHGDHVGMDDFGRKRPHTFHHKEQGHIENRNNDNNGNANAIAMHRSLGAAEYHRQNQPGSAPRNRNNNKARTSGGGGGGNDEHKSNQDGHLSD